MRWIGGFVSLREMVRGSLLGWLESLLLSTVERFVVKNPLRCLLVGFTWFVMDATVFGFVCEESVGLWKETWIVDVG